MFHDSQAPAAATNTADFNTVISGIYDAAMTPSLWPRVLEACREYIGGA